MARQDGGDIIAEVLAQHGSDYLFTLCGGHISPILVAAKRRGIRVVDVRDEANAVFAADAAARLTGKPGIAAVTAGPGVTNTLTAVKNAQMAQSPLVIFGGATATLLRGRGSLQDIDQLALMRPATKWATSVRTVAGLRPTVTKALAVAQEGVPGPVFVEVPVDLLYPEAMVREMFLKESRVMDAAGVGARALELVLKSYLFATFHAPHVDLDLGRARLALPRRQRGRDALRAARSHLERARRPVLVVGNQTMVNCREPHALAQSIERLGLPTYLAGAARGLLGRSSELQLRHKRGQALAEADVVVVAGFPFDFRLGYGRSINSKATVIAANLDATELKKNRRPEVAARQHPASFLTALAATPLDRGVWQDWMMTLRERETARDLEIATSSTAATELVNPLAFFTRLEARMADDAVIVVDGGDFVATAAYILRPRAPLSWLDPGVFGTLGVGGGFALAASLCRPDAEVWLIYGDGSSAYSLAEFDTFVRHGVAPIAVIGTDGAWAQIAREQVEMLGDDVGTVLRRSAYHEVAQGYGGVGLLLDDPAAIDDTIARAKEIAAAGQPVVINVHIAASDFRKGSISM